MNTAMPHFLPEAAPHMCAPTSGSPPSDCPPSASPDLLCPSSGLDWVLVTGQEPVEGLSGPQRQRQRAHPGHGTLPAWLNHGEDGTL